MRNWSMEAPNVRIFKVKDLDNRGVGERGERGGGIEISHKIKPKEGDRKFHNDDCLFTEFLLQTYFTWCSFL